MKNLFVLLFVCFLMIASGSVSYSADAPKLELKISGMFDVQSFYMQNVPPARQNPSPGIYSVVNPDYSTFTASGIPTKAINKKVSYWDQRAQIKFDFIMAKELSATAMFEIDSTRWGDTPGGHGGLISDRGRTGFWSSDRASVEVKNLFIDAAIPYFGIPVPMTVRLGVQPLSIRPNVFVYTDGAGITGGIKLDQLVGVPVDVIPYYFKMIEGSDWASDDSEIWGLQTKATLGKVTVGGYGLYYNMNSYPLWVLTNPTADPTFPTSLWSYVQGTQEANMCWVGTYADGQAGPINFNFDFVYDFGKVKNRESVTPGTDPVKYAGWLSRLKLDYPWQKFNFGVIGMYASGADTTKTDANGFPGTSRRVGSYVVPVGSEQPQGNNESVVFYGMEAGGSTGAGYGVIPSYYKLARGGFGGTWHGKMYASWKPVPFYKVTLQGLYIGDTTRHGNTVGNSVVPGTTTLRDDKLIGYEIDWLNDFQVYNNLRFWFGVGYLITGPALDLQRGTGATENFSFHNPWALRTRLQYTF